jgi:hypothetical protein
LSTLLPPGRRPLLLTIDIAVLLLFYQASIAFAAPADD